MSSLIKVSRSGRRAAPEPEVARQPVPVPVPVPVPEIEAPGEPNKVFNPVSRKFVSRGGIVHKRLISAGLLPRDESLKRKTVPPKVADAWAALKREKERYTVRARAEAKRDYDSDTCASEPVTDAEVFASELDAEDEEEVRPRASRGRGQRQARRPAVRDSQDYDEDLVRAVAKRYATDLSDMSETDAIEFLREKLERL